MWVIVTRCLKSFLELEFWRISLAIEFLFENYTFEYFEVNRGSNWLLVIYCEIGINVLKAS